jgi:hypothetical protein
MSTGLDVKLLALLTSDPEPRLATDLARQLGVDLDELRRAASRLTPLGIKWVHRGPASDDIEVWAPPQMNRRLRAEARIPTRAPDGASTARGRTRAGRGDTRSNPGDFTPRVSDQQVLRARHMYWVERKGLQHIAEQIGISRGYASVLCRGLKRQNLGGVPESRTANRRAGVVGNRFSDADIQRLREIVRFACGAGKSLTEAYEQAAQHIGCTSIYAYLVATAQRRPHAPGPVLGRDYAEVSADRDEPARGTPRTR